MKVLWTTISLEWQNDGNMNRFSSFVSRERFEISMQLVLALNVHCKMNENSSNTKKNWKKRFSKSGNICS